MPAIGLVPTVHKQDGEEIVAGLTEAARHPNQHGMAWHGGARGPADAPMGAACVPSSLYRSSHYTGEHTEFV